MYYHIFLYFFSGILTLLPLFYSLETQQIFSVNKFTLLLSALGISGLLFSSPFFSYKKISKYTLFFSSTFVVIALFSTYFSLTPIISFFGNQTRHFGILFFLILFLTFLFVSTTLKNFKISARDKKISTYIFIPLTIAGILSALWAILQYMGYPPLFGDILQFESLSGRSFAGMGQPNFLAQFLLFPFFIALYFLVQLYKNQQKIQSFFILQLILLYIFALYTTGSRAGILGIVSGMSVLLTAYIALRQHKPKILTIGISFILISILGLFTLILFHGDAIASFLGERGNSIVARYYFWNHAIELIQEYFWTGIGADMTGNILGPHLSISALESENFSAMPDRVHTLFLDIFLQFGFFGFALFLFGIWKTIHTGLQSLKQSYNTVDSVDYISLFALSGVIGILTTWIFGFPVLTDSLIAIVFIAIIFRNSKPLYFSLPKIFSISIHFLLFLFSLFLLHTAYTIHQSEIAIFSFAKPHTSTERKALSEKIIQTPYFEKNLFLFSSYFTQEHQAKILKLGERYNLQNTAYYNMKIEKAIAQYNISEAKKYMQYLEKQAGNLFTMRISAIQIAKKYTIISDTEYQTKMQYIARNLIPSYYFKSENYNDKKFQKFWKHHKKTAETLFQYR